MTAIKWLQLIHNYNSYRMRSYLKS
jgi:hypothetical protein